MPGDELLRIFSHQPVTDPAASWWLRHWMTEESMKHDIKQIPGFEEAWEKLVEEGMATMPVEKRLAGLTPEQQILALHDDVLRTLPEAYIRTLSAEVQEVIRRRIGHRS